MYIDIIINANIIVCSPMISLALNTNKLVKLLNVLLNHTLDIIIVKMVKK